MKRNHAAWLFALLVFTPACIINTGGVGEAAGGGNTGASAGLENLKHYRATLVRSIHAQTDEGAVVREDKFSMAVWSEAKAVFETIETADETGEAIQMTVGNVGEAGYLWMDDEGGCRVYWDAGNIEVDPKSLTSYLYPMEPGPAAGDEDVNGIPAHVFQVNLDSLGVKDVEAMGKLWYAADGGYLLKYQVELTGSKALFGTEKTGTMTLEYELSEVDNGAPVDYPADCQPVLTDIPAMDDAQDLLRLPSRMEYISVSAPEKVLAFYDGFFTKGGWEKIDESDLAERGMEYIFIQTDSNRFAILTLRPEDGNTVVKVETNDARPEEPTPSANETPAGGSDEPPNTRIMTSLSDLLGSAETPGALPSFAMVTDQELPAASGKTVTRLEAEVEGLNIHYVHTSGGKTTNAYLVDGKEYEVVGDIAEAGSIGLRTNWILWQTDWLKVLMAAGLANPKAEPGTTLDGRAVEVYSVDGTDLPDMTGGILPVQITAIRGTIWVDQATGALLKADLTFDADVKKKGETTATHDTGKFLLVVSRIGKVTVSLG